MDTKPLSQSLFCLLCPTLPEVGLDRAWQDVRLPWGVSQLYEGVQGGWANHTPRCNMLPAAPVWRSGLYKPPLCCVWGTVVSGRLTKEHNPQHMENQSASLGQNETGMLC